jgi:hypothetical protein
VKKKKKDMVNMTCCEYCKKPVAVKEIHVYDNYVFCPGCWYEYCDRHKIDKSATSSKKVKK